MRNVTLVIVALAISTSVLGCTGEKQKGYVEPGYPGSYFEHPKLGEGLNKTYYIYETQGIDAATAFFLQNPRHIVENGSIDAWVSITENNETYINTLKSIGLQVLEVTNATDISGEIEVHTFLPISKIREVGELQFVKAVYIKSKPVLE